MENRRNQSTKTNQTEQKYHIVVQYAQGLCECYKTTYRKYGVQVHFKGGNTVKNLLMFSKDKDAITKVMSYTGLSMARLSEMISI